MDESKFAKPTGLTGDWVDERETFFWHEGNPFAVKHAVEKMTGMLLQRDPADEPHLCYRGGHASGPEPREVRLRFEAVIGSRRLYSLRVKSTSPRNWVTEENHLKAANRAFAYWCSQLPAAAAAGIDWASASAEQLARDERESIALETVAAFEDPAPINAVQTEILDALRAGMSFATAHHEGGTHLFFDGKVFVRSDYGEDPNTETYPDGAAMLVCLRKFYDWESRRDTYPHKPPELAVWKYIQSQLRK
jgi:hypothetical protein